MSCKQDELTFFNNSFRNEKNNDYKGVYNYQFFCKSIFKLFFPCVKQIKGHCAFKTKIEIFVCNRLKRLKKSNEPITRFLKEKTFFYYSFIHVFRSNTHLHIFQNPRKTNTLMRIQWKSNFCLSRSKYLKPSINCLQKYQSI